MMTKLELVKRIKHLEATLDYASGELERLAIMFSESGEQTLLALKTRIRNYQSKCG
jgi:hypothetical protein